MYNTPIHSNKKLYCYKKFKYLYLNNKKEMLMLKNKIKILILIMIVGCLIFPSISAEMLFSKKIYDEEIGKVCFKSSLDIEIKEFKFVKNKFGDKNISQYELIYLVKNSGKWLYIGKPSFVMRFDNSERVIDRWDGR